jgi:hypothetical protein
MQQQNGKKKTIDVAGARFLRYPIRTHLITAEDDILAIAERYVREQARKDDCLFISERVVAITQGRAIPIDSIQPSRMATRLAGFVTNNPAGIGLRSPWTMELAIREAGWPRMVAGMAAAALTKPLGIRGVFYHVVGRGVNAIDGPCDYTIPPYNRCATLAPKDPNMVARRLASVLAIPVVIIDANDLGVAVLGRSHPELSPVWCKAVFRDNPLGQSTEQTPLCLVRKI